jgi:dienelactone hydrolase
MSTFREHTTAYSCGDLRLEGFAAIDSSKPGRRPVVVICHAWGGQDDFVREKARKVAAMGYLGFAADVYGLDASGTPRRGSTPEECGALMTPLVEDRGELRKRLVASVEAARALPEADSAKVVAMGYCFGGLCALDIARANAAGVIGAVSFHGLFMPPGLGEQSAITAKVLACHGWDDPMATPDSVLGFAKEMTDAKADWQLHAYGHAKHAFTNPQAADHERGIVYEPKADARSWEALGDFLRECFR